MSNTRRSRPEPRRPPPEFGQRAIEIAQSLGKSKKQLMRELGYDGTKTLDRLVKGEGSMAFAMSVRDLLRDMGADVSSLPALSDEDGGGVAEPWLREWIDLGKRLHALASEVRYGKEVDYIRRVVVAHEVVAEGTDKFPPSRT